MSVQQITNYRELSERLASSGQPEEIEFKDISAAGYEVVINLAMPNSDNAIPEEGQIVSARKMIYVHLPVPFENPTPSDLRVFLGLMETFSDKKCWVHCALNMRASAFLFQYYKLVLGVPLHEANKVLLPDWQPNDVWNRFMSLKAEDLGL